MTSKLLTLFRLLVGTRPPAGQGAACRYSNRQADAASHGMIIEGLVVSRKVQPLCTVSQCE